MDLVLIAIILIAGFFGARTMVSAHEKAHVQICEYYGGTADVVKKGFFFGSVTCVAPPENQREMRLADSMVEAVTYMLFPLYASVIVLCLLIALFV